MNDSSYPNVELLLSRARSDEQLGELLEHYRSYLKLLARLQVGKRLQGKVDASDIVQETFLQVQRTFSQFRGTTEQELLAWLRRVLANVLANLVRHFYRTQRRDVRLELEMGQQLNSSSQSIAHVLANKQRSPSEHAMEREQAVILANLIEQLPEDYREVVTLRHVENISFPMIAERMGRSVDSVKKLWTRALVRLRQLRETAS